MTKQTTIVVIGALRVKVSFCGEGGQQKETETKLQIYHIYSKYSDTLTPYHLCLNPLQSEDP